MIFYDNSTKTGVSKTVSDPLKQAQSPLKADLCSLYHTFIVFIYILCNTQKDINMWNMIFIFDWLFKGSA